jgi:hypothetical protein
MLDLSTKARRLDMSLSGIAYWGQVRSLGSDDFGTLLQLAYSNVGRSSGIGPFDQCQSPLLDSSIDDLSPNKSDQFDRTSTSTIGGKARQLPHRPRRRGRPVVLACCWRRSEDEHDRRNRLANPIQARTGRSRGRRGDRLIVVVLVVVLGLLVVNKSTTKDGDEDDHGEDAAIA